MIGGPKAAAATTRAAPPSPTRGSTGAPRARQVRTVCEAAAANVTPKYNTMPGSPAANAAIAPRNHRMPSRTRGPSMS